MLVTMPLLGVFAVILITMLTLQKSRLQVKLDDSNWWLLNYSDISILVEPKVWMDQSVQKTKRTSLILKINFKKIDLQAVQAVSVSTSKSGSGGSQTIISSNSFGMKDKGGKESIFVTIGLFQVQRIKGTFIEHRHDEPWCLTSRVSSHLLRGIM